MFEAIIQEILTHDTIVVHRHARPDGDAAGCQLGLKRILQENFPEKRIFAVGDPLGNFSFLEDSAMNEIPDHYFEGALCVILDCGSEKLISDSRYKMAAKTVRIDHHLFTGKFADEEVVDSGFESCCGMIALLAEENNLQVSMLAAKALYTGMVTDSGRFRFDQTSARTFRLAAFLMERGINPAEIFAQLYAEDFENKKRKAQFLLKTRFTEHRVAYIYTTRQELEEMGISPYAASRAMVGNMADIKGTGIWVNFTEAEEGVLCELRSSGVNINPVAVKYGGGGHAKASGATVADRETAMAMLQDLDRMTGEDR